MTEGFVNDTDEPVDAIAGVDYWRGRWADTALALTVALEDADRLADQLRSAYAVIKRLHEAGFNPAILDRIHEALHAHRDAHIAGRPEDG